MLGWVPFLYMFIPPEEINNPRPIYKRVYDEGLAGVMHYLDDYRKGICGHAWSLSSVMDVAGSKMAIDDLDKVEPVDEKWVKQFLPCPDCLAKLKK